MTVGGDIVTAGDLGFAPLRERMFSGAVRLLNVVGFGWLTHLFALGVSGIAYLVGVRNDAPGWVLWPVILGSLVLGYGLAVQTIVWVREWEQRHPRGTDAL